jgi:hypothetical protein
MEQPGPGARGAWEGATKKKRRCGETKKKRTCGEPIGRVDDARTRIAKKV